MKLTKKELEEVREATKRELNERVQYRKNLIEQYENYYEDVEALKRVYKMKNEMDKLELDGYTRYRLKEDEQKEVLENYPLLKDLDSKYNWIIADISYNCRKSPSDIYGTKFNYSDTMRTLWNEEDVKTLMEALDMLGYTELRYGNSSTIATQNIHYIIMNSKFQLKYSYIDDEENYGKPVLVFGRNLVEENISKKENEKEVEKARE